MAKKLAGESTKEELLELEAILKWNPEAGGYMNMLSEWWQMTEKIGPVSTRAFDSFLKRMEKSEQALTRKSITEKWLVSFFRFCNELFFRHRKL